MTQSIVTVNMSPQVAEGEVINVVDFSGASCLTDAGCPEVQWINLEITFCAIDLDLIPILNPSWRAVKNRAGETIGWAEKGKLSCDTGYALELWVGVKGSSVCDDPNASGSWGYLLLPWVVGGAVGDLEITNGAISFVFNGRTQRGSRWGVGPYNVELDGTTPVPLAFPIQADEDRLFITTGYAPPDAVCGCQPVPAIAPAPTLAIIEGTSPLEASASATPGTTGNTMRINWGDGSASAVITAGTPLTHTYAASCTTTAPCQFDVVLTETIASPPAGGASQVVTVKTVTIPFP